jgi:hypothetical protein
MNEATEAAQRTVEIGKQRIVEQTGRIERQRELLEKLQGEGQDAPAGEAKIQLQEMTNLLVQMKRDLSKAEGRLLELTDPLDEKSLEEVMRECPL